MTIKKCIAISICEDEFKRYLISMLDIDDFSIAEDIITPKKNKKKIYTLIGESIFKMMEIKDKSCN